MSIRAVAAVCRAIGALAVKPEPVIAEAVAPEVLGRADGEAVVITHLDIDAAHFATNPIDFELGFGGCTMRSAIVLVGAFAYVYWLREADTPAGVVPTGYDPGDFVLDFPETANRVGYAVVLPAGYVTPEAHSDLFAALLATIPGVREAVPRVGSNVDGSWRLDFEGPQPANGARGYAARGAAGPFGGHAYRLTRVGEAYTGTSVDIVRPLATAIQTPHASAIVWAIQIPIGTTAGTGSTARPRLQMRVGPAAATTASTSTLLGDFGQIPASEIAVERLATIYLTPVQCREWRDRLDTVGSSQLWIQAHATGGCHYISATLASTGSITQGQQVAQNLRTEATPITPAGTGPATWASAGEGSVTVYLNARLLYEIEPCTTGEHRRIWGSARDSSTPPDAIGPIGVNPVYTTGEGDANLVGCRLYSSEGRLGSGDSRHVVHVGGSGTKDAPDALGSTRLVDLGSQSGAGVHEYLAPTGADTVRIPALGSGHLWHLRLSSGAFGYGELGPSPHTVGGRPIDPTSWIRASGANRGTTTMQEDRVGDNGSAASTSTSPAAGTTLNTDNNPWLRVHFRQPAIAIAAA